MREAEYRRTRKQIEAEVKSAETALARVQAKLGALDLLWNEHFSRDCKGAADAGIVHALPPLCVDGPISLPEDEATTEKTLIVNGQAQSLVDDIACSMVGKFGVREILQAIHDKHPDKTVDRTTVSGRLRHLANSGKIKLLIPGVGRRPGVFGDVSA